MTAEFLVLTICRDEDRAVKFAEEVKRRCPDVLISKVISFGPPELCYGRGCYVQSEKRIRSFLNKKFGLKPPM